MTNFKNKEIHNGLALASIRVFLEYLIMTLFFLYLLYGEILGRYQKQQINGEEGRYK